MVPHRKILRAIALAAHASLDHDGTKDALCSRFRVRFPRDFPDFVKREIFDYISPEVEALLLTKDPTKIDNTGELIAAEELGVIDILAYTPNGLSVVVPEALVKLRRHDTLRVCIETMLLCAIPITTIVDDVRGMYGLQITEGEIIHFAELFVDREFAEGDPWIEYTQCIGSEETRFKFQLMNAPKDYVRWKLGARVHLDNEQVLDRLMSDSYYATQQMKHEVPHPNRDDIVMIKMHRDTLFKAMDRRLKMKEVDAATGSKGNESAASLISNIIVKYGSDQNPLAKDLDDGEQPPLASELKDG